MFISQSVLPNTIKIRRFLQSQQCQIITHRRSMSHSRKTLFCAILIIMKLVTISYCDEARKKPLVVHSMSSELEIYFGSLKLEFFLLLS